MKFVKKHYHQIFFTFLIAAHTITFCAVTFKNYIGTVPPEALDLIEQLKNADKYEKLGVPVTKGILLYGPPGSGKTYLVRAIAHEINCPLIAINGSDFAHNFTKTIPNLFSEAEEAAVKSSSKTAIIFIDEFDAIGSRTNRAFTEDKFYNGIINSLLSEMDGFYERKDVKIVVIAATNFIEAIDPALKRSGRLDYKINIPYPDFNGRKMLIEHFLKLYPSDSNVSSDWLAESTENMSQADIKLLFDSAGRIAVRNDKNSRDYDCFAAALETVTPITEHRNNEFRIDSVENLVNPKNLITFKEYIGNIPSEALDLVEQLKNSEKYKQLNVPVSKGILLYGPPGSGKTYLARAIAGEAKCPFIATNGTDFSETYVGQSKMAVKNLFSTAEKVAKGSLSKTAIIFIDELDAIGSRSNPTMRNNSSHIEIINTLLSEMDGFNKRSDINIVVIGASNLIDSIDSALRRAGRLDYKIYVPYPDKDSRKQLIEYFLKTYVSDTNLSSDWLAENTEGMSPADIKFIFEDAGRIAIRNNKKTRDQESFVAALKSITRETERAAEAPNKNTGMPQEIKNILKSLFPQVHKPEVILPDNSPTV